MRAVVATTVVWIFTRIAFWVGYYCSSAQRRFGAPGMVLSVLVLLYVCSRVGAELAGPASATAVVMLSGAAEALLPWQTSPLPSERKPT